MIRQSFIEMIVIIACSTLLTNCGGTSMSGNNNIIKKKERPTPSKDEDAKEPQVVTGAYLFCDFSPKDSPSAGMDAVGCSLMSSDMKKIKATEQNKVTFSKSLSGGSYKAPEKLDTSGENQAVFIQPNTETKSTKFIVSYQNKTGIDEMVCEGAQLPCKKIVQLDSLPTYLDMKIDAMWRVDSMMSGTTKFLSTIRPNLFCSPDKLGQPSIMIGHSPIEHLLPTFGQFIPAKLIEGASKMSIARTNFCAMKTRPNVIPIGPTDRGFSTSGNGCHLALLSKTNAGPIRLDHTSAEGTDIKHDLFVIIVKSTQQTDQELEAALADFACK